MSEETLSKNELLLYGFLAFVKSKESLTPAEPVKPIIRHAIHTIQRSRFSTAEIQSEILSVFGKSFPTIVVQRLLTELCIAGDLKRDEHNANEWVLLGPVTGHNDAIVHARRSINTFYRALSAFVADRHPKFQNVPHSTIVKWSLPAKLPRIFFYANRTSCGRLDPFLLPSEFHIVNVFPGFRIP